MTVQEGNKHLLSQLEKVYDKREALNITDLILEQITKLNKTERILFKTKLLNNAQQKTLNKYLQQLLQYKPVQYVLGEAWFAGMKFLVDENVLIPRPETEELVEWVIKDNQHPEFLSVSANTIHKSILDVGTGSGCIPITLKKNLKDFSVSSLDISKGAIAIAQKNAALNNTDIHLLLFNFLEEAQWVNLPVFDIIISNPPYIKQSEEKSMHRNVLDFEPPLALFVPDNDALLFYRKLVKFSNYHLAATGKIFVEINEVLGKEVLELFIKEGFNAELKKDMQQKDRMLKAMKIIP